LIRGEVLSNRKKIVDLRINPEKEEDTIFIGIKKDEMENVQVFKRIHMIRLLKMY